MRERADEQPCAGQQHDGQRDFRADQDFAHEARTTGNGTRSRGDGAAQVDAACFERRQRAEEQTSEQRCGDRKRQHAAIQGEAADRDHFVGQQILHQRKKRQSQGQAHRASGQGQHQVFGP